MPNRWGLHQQIVLLALNDGKGLFTGSYYAYAIAGAVLSELLLSYRIVASDDKQKIVNVVSREPTGDPFLDECLLQIIESSKPRKLQDWVGRIAGNKDLPHLIAEQLCQLGVLRRDEKKILWLFSKRIYPESNGTVEDDIRAQMARVMFDPQAVLDERTVILIALASHAGLLKSNFVPEELSQHRERVQQLAKGEILAAGATREAIAAVQAAVMMAVMLPAIVAATTN
ncbi:MAG: GPP34 family phosphoprotein [Mariniblastus sp.]|nr:GPP34 family phosphoprotein [Mariniblastus sp.]